LTEILFEDLSFSIVGVAMEVHKVLGPAFLEIVYQRALAYKLLLRGILFEEQKLLPVDYKGQRIDDYKADFVVDGKIIVEIKVTTTLTNAHEAQALNYLAATGYRLAILLNFGTSSLQQKRVVK
jgi:GxxExxY protein